MLSRVQMVELDPSNPAHLSAFRDLNLAWVASLFKVEPADEETLCHPQRAVLDKGGRILLAVLPEQEGGEVLGTAALLREREGRYELSKMSVRGDLKGKGLGRRLMLALLDLYETIPSPPNGQPKELFLESSTKLVNALGLYESCGFKHVPKPPSAENHYGRADVYMAWTKEWALEAEENAKAAKAAKAAAAVAAASIA
jgi:GNAT superfamily N-acetyltransferase